MNDEFHHDHFDSSQLPPATPGEYADPVPMPPNLKPKQEIWVRIFDDEETRRREEELGLDAVQLSAFRKLAAFFRLTRYDMSQALPVPPQGSLYLPSHVELDEPSAAAASVEHVEERVDYSRGEPRYTCVRKRTVPVRKVKPGHPDFEKLWAEEAEEKAAAERAAAAKLAAEAEAMEVAGVLREQNPAPPIEPGSAGFSQAKTLATPTDADPAASPPVSCETADRVGPEKNRPGPKPLLNDALQTEICVHLRVGLSRSVTAASLGIHKSTITRTMQRDPEFRRQVLLAEATFQKTRTLCLLKAARESWRAGAWMYKHYHPHLSTRRMQRADEARFAKEAVRQMSTAIQQSIAKAA